MRNAARCSSVSRVGGKINAAAESFRITLLDSGESYSCGAESTVLKGMEQLGRKGIAVGCRGGGCGICKIEIVRGDYGCQRMSRAHISEEDEARGVVLACRTRPRSDLDVRVLGKLQRAVMRGLG